MSKKEELIVKYAAHLEEHFGVKRYDKDLMEAAVKACGPSIYNRDASTVSCSDQTEKDRVRDNFCKKKLGLGKDAAAKEIDKVCAKYGARNKYRAVFYYMLSKNSKKAIG